MSDFRIKLLGLAALATVCTGISYGQVSCLTAPGGTLEPTSLNTLSPILDRAESEADLVSDVILLCPSSTATSNGELTVFASLPVSSKAVTGATGGGVALPAGALAAAGTFSGTLGNSEAVLAICAAQPLGTGCTGVASAYYQGTVSGSIVTFTGVTFPAAFTAQISNIRLNFSGAAIGSTPTPETESIFAGSNGLATVVYNNVIVGYGLKSLVTPVLAGALTTPTGTFVSSYTVCNGNSSGSAFTVNVAETFGGFFKTHSSNHLVAGLHRNFPQDSCNL